MARASIEPTSENVKNQLVEFEVEAEKNLGDPIESHSTNLMLASFLRRFLFMFPQERIDMENTLSFPLTFTTHARPCFRVDTASRPLIHSTHGVGVSVWGVTFKQ